MAGGSEIDDWQDLIAKEAQRRWPHMTAMSEGLALAEEAGEVCRALLKRFEGTRGTSAEWTKQLKVEIGQTFFVLLNLCSMEGYEASEALDVAWAKFQAKPATEPMNLEDE